MTLLSLAFSAQVLAAAFAILIARRRASYLPAAVALAVVAVFAFAACSGPIDPTPPEPIVGPESGALLQDAGQDASGDAP